MAVAQNRPRHDVGEDQGHETGEQSEDQELAGVAFDALHVHLKTGQEHDVVEAHAAEDLEGDVALKDVQAVFADDDACQHHTDDVRDAQLTHDNRRKEHDQQHDEEDHRGVGNREIVKHKPPKLGGWGSERPPAPG